MSKPKLYGLLCISLRAVVRLQIHSAAGLLFRILPSTHIEGTKADGSPHSASLMQSADQHSSLLRDGLAIEVDFNLLAPRVVTTRIGWR